MSKIFVSRTTESNVYQAIIKAFDFFKIDFHFNIAVIKLNFCSLKLRETGATSDPIVVEQMIKVFNEHNVSVRLVESNSASKDADLAFDYLGFRSLERRYDVKCVNLSRDEFSVKKIDGYYLKSIKIPKTLEAADFFITHPKLKTHCSLKVHMTGALKNQFGCLMDRNKEKYHSRIHEVIADVNEAIKPDLTVMDAIIAMTGYGPTTGVPMRLNMIFTSQDPVAMDAFGAKLLGFNPMSIKYIKLSAKKGLGNTGFSLCGDKPVCANVDLHVNKFITQSFELLSSLGINAP